MIARRGDEPDTACSQCGARGADVDPETLLCASCEDDYQDQLGEDHPALTDAQRNAGAWWLAY